MTLAQDSTSSTLVAPLSLSGNFSWTLVGNLVYAGCQWGIITILAKLGTPEMVGQFMLGLAVTAPVIMFFNLQLRQVQVTDAEGRYEFSQYLYLRLLTTALGLIIIIATAFLSGYPHHTALVILVIGLAKAFEAVSDIFYGVMQKYERMDRIANSMIIKGLMTLSAVGIAVHLSRNVLWGAISIAVVWLFTLFFVDIRNARTVLTGRRIPITLGKANSNSTETVFRCRWGPASLWRLAWLSLPLGLVMLLISLNANIPRYFIQHYLGTAQLGIFGAMSYILVAGNTVVGALGQAASPRLSRYYAGRDIHGFRSLLLKLLGIGSLLGAVGILVALFAGRDLLTLLYSPQYAQSSNVFVWLMAASAIWTASSFMGYGMTAASYFRAQTPLFIIVTASTALFGYFLIPMHGLLGAVMAILCSLVLQFIGSAFVLMHAIKHGASKTAGGANGQ